MKEKAREDTGWQHEAAGGGKIRQKEQYALGGRESEVGGGKMRQMEINEVVGWKMR